MKQNHIETVKQKDSKIENMMLANEDIRLFVEVVEEETDKLNDNRRFWSVNASRQSLLTQDINQISLPAQWSPLVSSYNNSKYTVKRKIKMLNPKWKRIRRSNAAVVIGKLKKKWYSETAKLFFIINI